MKKLIILVGLGLALSGCSNNLNEFDYADITQQANVVFIDKCMSGYENDYCKILKNGDLVYFDTTFEDYAIINPVDEFDNELRKIQIGVYYDKYTQVDDINYKQWLREVMRDMRKQGLGENVIYVIEDINGDLVFRMTNGKVDYSYFDTKEARGIYDEYSNERNERETKIKELQDMVTRYENYVNNELNVAKSKEDYYSGSSSSYVQELAYYLSECNGSCTSNLMTYEEAKELTEVSDVDLYSEWFKKKISRK